MSAARVRLGMITPSSNTMLEPATARLLAPLPEVSAHFARLRVTDISASASSSAQFDLAPMIAAAELLADARCAAICWNGTSASWLGIDRDRALCAAIEERTGIPATTAVLALLEAFAAAGVRRYGLVTPYVDAIQERIVATLAAQGFECAAERHAGLHVNFDFASLDDIALDGLVREVAAARPDAITVLCTNVDAAGMTPALEAATGIRIFDSIALALWGALRCAGVPPRRLRDAGRLFRELA